MDAWAIVLIAVGIPVIILLFLAGFLVLLYSIFNKVSGWKSVDQRWETMTEPPGKKLTRQTIKVGIVRWRFCVTVVFSPQGMYMHLGQLVPILSSLRPYRPVLIPWSEFNSPRKGRLYLGWKAVQLSVGNPEIAAITFPMGIYKEMTSYLDPSVIVKYGDTQC